MQVDPLKCKTNDDMRTQKQRQVFNGFLSPIPCTAVTGILVYPVLHQEVEIEMFLPSADGQDRTLGQWQGVIGCAPGRACGRRVFPADGISSASFDRFPARTFARH